MSDFIERIGLALAEGDATTKAQMARRLAQDYQALVPTCACWAERDSRLEAGRPQAPKLVPPAQVPQRKLGTTEGRAALIHAISHIEFNAINLALDAAYRFLGLPSEYYAEWVRIAGEEALHFSLLVKRLNDLGFAYGDFDAHNGLWQMALDTAHDPLVRMALVPRVLEARGLDVTPDITRRLEGVGDHETVRILGVIARDEVTHVEAGSRWFNYLCAQRRYEPESCFQWIVGRYMKQLPKGPFYREARLAAGFSEDELNWLETGTARA